MATLEQCIYSFATPITSSEDHGKDADGSTIRTEIKIYVGDKFWICVGSFENNTPIPPNTLREMDMSFITADWKSIDFDKITKIQSTIFYFHPSLTGGDDYWDMRRELVLKFTEDKFITIGGPTIVERLHIINDQQVIKNNFIRSDFSYVRRMKPPIG